MTDSSTPPISSSSATESQASSEPSSSGKPVLYNKDGSQDGRQLARDYTLKEKMEALGVMVLHNGSRSKASQATGVPENTLSCWAYGTMRDEYMDLRQRMRTELREQEAEKHMQAAAEAIEIEHEVSARLRENIDKLEPRDLSNAHRNLATSAGIHNKNAQELRGEGIPQVKVNMDVGEVLRALGGEFAKVGAELPEDFKAAIEGEAEEVKD